MSLSYSKAAHFQKWKFSFGIVFRGFPVFAFEALSFIGFLNFRSFISKFTDVRRFFITLAGLLDAFCRG
jgi:hypothetical protein